MRIGIGVTTYKRPDMLGKCMTNIVRHTLGVDYRSVIHDDTNSEKGVAASKNACIKYLMDAGCDHVFLFDDDTWPDRHDWWKRYVESPMEHLAYIWFPKWDSDRNCWPLRTPDNGTDYNHTGWNTSNGCMLYYTREALETAGGMRTQFGKWGFEHLEHSHRIHRFGLTPEPFISLSEQRGIYASDQEDDDYKSTISSITTEERREHYARNLDLYKYWIEKEPEFVPWD